MSLCKYAYKQCYNVRSAKRDGELHRLCDYHREKANSMQKTYATKRRQERRAQRGLPATPHFQDTTFESLPLDQHTPYVDLACLVPADELITLFDDVYACPFQTSSVLDGELTDDEVVHLYRLLC
ncbi:Aste57867_133 [Aphanomyces stellatus]|uniref:Aste57867_133 protein n=1 Tax=Aphanomyces stellatus TaxID=120398 RepID=A0A485K327_9STRA|nr:hypothetical protein As57867_000133 [Aphanomyces stellatus]VFT77359.1 Aste57867_133 [Aphanomyces stellatus]